MQSGFVGYDAPRRPGAGATPQPRHKLGKNGLPATIRLEDVYADAIVNGVLARWWDAQGFPDAPPYSGGVLDSWPAVDVDGFGTLARESAAIDSLLNFEATTS